MTKQHEEELQAKSSLGKVTHYAHHYDPQLLFAIERKTKRRELNIKESLTFYGYDIWNAYEISFLNLQGKPIVATASITVAANSPCIFESKSLKLYLNSFNHTHFKGLGEVGQLITQDLSDTTQSQVLVELQDLKTAAKNTITLFSGQNIDDLDITTQVYNIHPEFLTVGHNKVTETLNSDLLKSNCPVTHQPDWGSVYIQYHGNKIQPEGLLKYIISLRQHDDFHEHCIERIFVDIMQRCQPEELTVYGRYTRRGGIDINPLRSTQAELTMPNLRLVRQ